MTDVLYLKVDITAALARRRAAAARLAPMPCGCTDPLSCAHPGGHRTATVAAAVADYLDEHGLCACWAVPRTHPGGLP